MGAVRFVPLKPTLPGHILLQISYGRRMCGPIAKWTFHVPSFNTSLHIWQLHYWFARKILYFFSEVSTPFQRLAPSASTQASLVQNRDAYLDASKLSRKPSRRKIIDVRSAKPRCVRRDSDAPDAHVSDTKLLYMQGRNRTGVNM